MELGEERGPLGRLEGLQCDVVMVECPKKFTVLPSSYSYVPANGVHEALGKKKFSEDPSRRCYKIRYEGASFN